MAERPLDLHGRPLGVLRLSLTARCNLACPYCCPDSEDPPGLLSWRSGWPWWKRAWVWGFTPCGSPAESPCCTGTWRS